MAKTFTSSMSASPTKTPVTAQTWTRQIEVTEDPSVAGYPTTDYLVYAPTSSDLPVRMLAGTTFVFRQEAASAPYSLGQIVGYISGVSNSTTMSQVEQGVT